MGFLERPPLHPVRRVWLLGFEGVLDFLRLLGFSADASGMRLECALAPGEWAPAHGADRRVHTRRSLLLLTGGWVAMSRRGKEPL